MNLLLALLLSIHAMFSPAPPENVLTVAVYRDHTRLYDNGQLVTVFDDSCNDTRVWNTNAHRCNGNLDAMASLIDAYVPVPYGYIETFDVWLD